MIIEPQAGNSIVTGNVFHNFGASGSLHGIYLESNNNTIAYNKFYNDSAAAGILLKEYNNTIHDNEFYSFTGGAPPISIYEQHYTINNCFIYNNYFHNDGYGIIIGNSVDAYPSTHLYIYNNTFQSLTQAISIPLNYGPSSYTDIEIYYNQFTSCGTALYSTSAPASVLVDTQIAYNTFSPSISNPAIETFTNTMVYGNTGLTDYNVPSNKAIPPP
jgi:hypothetical protein